MEEFVHSSIVTEITRDRILIFLESRVSSIIFHSGEFISEFSIVERKIRGGKLGKEERVVEKQ